MSRLVDCNPYESQNIQVRVKVMCVRDSHSRPGEHSEQECEIEHVTEAIFTRIAYGENTSDHTMCKVSSTLMECRFATIARYRFTFSTLHVVWAHLLKIHISHNTSVGMVYRVIQTLSQFLFTNTGPKPTRTLHKVVNLIIQISF